MTTDNGHTALSITIFCIGDPSVGVHPAFWTIDSVIFTDEDEETREGFRNKITESFEFLTGESCYALYEDERPLENDVGH
jgi:hypothetical protein